VTTYTFTGAVAYDRLGSSWRTAAGLRSVSVTDPATGLLPTNLVQGGVAVSWLTADANSRYSFTCDVPGVVVDFGAGAEALYANEVPGLMANASSTYALTSQQRPGGRTVFLGDSITLASDTEAGFGGAVNTVTADSFVGYGCGLTSQRLTRIANLGIAGNKSADMLARFDTDVTPFTPQTVFVAAGANDIATAVTLATFQTNIKAIVAKCRTIGAVPIIASIFPNNNTDGVSVASKHATIIKWNVWLRRYCSIHGIIYIDFYSQSVDPATGNYLAAYGTGDGTHPGVAGQLLYGQYLAAQLGPLLPLGGPALTADDGDLSNLLAGGCFLGAPGAGGNLGIPAPWATYSGLISGGVYSTVTDSAVKGLLSRYTATATAGAAIVYQSIAAAGKFSVGDRLMVGGILTTNGGVTGQVSLNFIGGTPGSHTPQRIGLLAVTRQQLHLELTVPAGTTSIDFLLTAGAGTGVVDFGQMTLYNLTTMSALI